MKYLVAGLLAPFLLPLILAIPLWLIRRFAPRLESYFYGPLYNVGYLMGRTSAQTVRAIRRLVS
jgi:hypothetical protein